MGVDDSDGWKAIHQAAKQGNTRMVACLLSHGADVDDHRNTHLVTPLTLAAEYGHLDTVEYLLSINANPNVQDNQQVHHITPHHPTPHHNTQHHNMLPHHNTPHHTTTAHHTTTYHTTTTQHNISHTSHPLSPPQIQPSRTPLSYSPRNMDTERLCVHCLQSLH